ncbi:peptidoglycan-binding protein [Clostridium felsineum]|uniref:peptidoglycan-binding domain-containing protein n=1 Tax=Clostridium felsineum TaxID=36839 RepID=UPI00098BE21C|nr:peptidoglycan-binding protein [Clostridium felsineum]MCR3759629.1 peptidoglycan-binding protein [Clostridium felsineum]URZ02291.1 hypothetical protein CLAUR_022880 [Clostridium felsineum]
MKSLKMKALSLGIVSTVLLSSTAFAATNTKIQVNKSTKNITTQSSANPSRNYKTYYNSRADQVIARGGLIKLGDTGDAVKDVQACLVNGGFLSGGQSSIDGIFGQSTYNAVVYFQNYYHYQYGLSVDGIVGPATWNLLRGDL